MKKHTWFPWATCASNGRCPRKSPRVQCNKRQRMSKRLGEFKSNYRTKAKWLSHSPMEGKKKKKKKKEKSRLTVACSFPWGSHKLIHSLLRGRTSKEKKEKEKRRKQQQQRQRSGGQTFSKRVTKMKSHRSFWVWARPFLGSVITGVCAAGVGFLCVTPSPPWLFLPPLPVLAGLEAISSGAFGLGALVGLGWRPGSTKKAIFLKIRKRARRWMMVMTKNQ